MSQDTLILLVDDEPAVLQTFTLLLGVNGYAVRTACTGAEALQLTRQCLPSVASRRDV